MKLLKNIKSTLRKIDDIYVLLGEIRRTLPYIQEGIGRIEARQTAEKPVNVNGLAPHEFRVYSQWGEDGIIQHLIREVAVSRKVFVEFGVESYQESNTRFLLKHQNWSGLVLDAGEENIRKIKRDPLYWQYNLKAVQAFINRENINALITGNGVEGNIGLLSIDIDGNDYWVWEALDVVRPDILVIEYNARFGSERAVTTPYAANFERQKAHFSMIYYGASLKALCLLGEAKGYDFVGCNQAGNNAFFVEHNKRPSSIPKLTCQDGYVSCQFREARDEQGRLSFLTAEEEIAILASLELVEVSPHALTQAGA